ncbi:IS4 family transposase [Reichenbachiella sp. MALMAid0571]|uniref:IS4 family transposase n=1 Tax=Reichenbachiella sp. MALMAid0571 TaxID=3143939 RepID=UPI0032DF3525
MSKDRNLTGQPVICQLLSFIPRDLVERVATKHQSDHYYKTMTTFRQLVFILYGVISRCHSLSNLCKSLIFLNKRLQYLDITKLPSKSTLSDANINRSSDVFGDLYHQLYQHYRRYLTPNHIGCFINDEIDPNCVDIFDSSTIGLFTDVFKGAGRLPLEGRKKGGLKIHAKLPLTGFVPDLICLSEARKNDKDFLGQLNVEPGKIYLFDKGYVNYKKWKQIHQAGAYYLTRLNKNASYQILLGQPNHISEYANGGIIADQTVAFDSIQARVVTYKDFETGKVLKFVTNLMDCQPETIAYLYKCRWSIELLFKRLKQNFELNYFYSDSCEGIKTQIWIALIANLIFTVIHRQVKECELFTTIVSMASANLGSYMSLVKVVKTSPLTDHSRNLQIVQLNMFDPTSGGVYENLGKDP